MSILPIKGRRITLVGGAGFIGHNLALALKAQGADVQVIDSLQINNLISITSNKDNVPNRELYLALINERLELLRKHDIPLHVLDARDYGAISTILSQLQPETLIHLAAVAHANRANKDPHSTFDHSLRTMENTLDYARNKGTHYIYLSSSMVYGNFEGGAVTEETTCNPLGIYGALKFAGEKMVIAYNQVFDMHYTIIRPSALYGERCVSRRVGQVFIENALQGLDVVLTGSTEDRLDFTYIGDFVNGVIRCIENEASHGQVFNITCGNGRSLGEMLEILKEHFPDINVRLEPKDVLMPDRGTLSIEKARRMIGYDSQYPLEKGFVRYIEWYKEMSEKHGHAIRRA